MPLHPDFGRTLRLHIRSREECRARESYGLQKDSQKTFCGDLIGDLFRNWFVLPGNALGEFVFFFLNLEPIISVAINRTIMFQHKKCFTIESLVGKDSNSSSVGDELIRPTALRYTESVHPAPFGSCFQNSARTLYGNVNADMMFPDPGSHSANSALALRHLPIPTQPFFSPHQRDSLHFYPWVLRNRYLGHRFQGQY